MIPKNSLSILLRDACLVLKDFHWPQTLCETLGHRKRKWGWGLWGQTYSMSSFCKNFNPVLHSLI